MKTDEAQTGSPFPLGPTITPQGVNFSVLSTHASAVEIVFFDHDGASEPSRVVSLDPTRNRTSQLLACLCARESSPASSMDTGSTVHMNRRADIASTGKRS